MIFYCNINGKFISEDIHILDKSSIINYAVRLVIFGCNENSKVYVKIRGGSLEYSFIDFLNKFLGKKQAEVLITLIREYDKIRHEQESE